MPSTVVPQPPRVAASPLEAEESLVHPIVRGPVALLLAWTLPTLALCFVCGQAFYIAWSEMSPSNRGWAYAAIAALGANLALSLGLAVWLARAGKRMTARRALGPLAFLLVHVGFSSAVMQMWLPPSIEQWMVSTNRLLLLHWSFLAMPTCLLATIVGGFRSPNPGAERSRVSIAALLSVPVALYASLLLFAGMAESGGAASSAVAVIGFAFCAVAMGVSIFRLLLLGWDRIFRSPVNDAVATALVALAAPLCGLLLNSGIPFPADFQHAGVYALTILTAASLLLPLGRSSRWNVCVWTLRCLTLPFSLYFFFVFLPYLAFALPAMIVFGAGILIFAPTFLLFFHLQKLWRAYHGADRSPALYATLGLVAASAIPGYIWIEARLMRAELHRGMDFALAPDVETPQAYPGIPYLTEKSLEWLHAFKEGQHYPILSPFRMQSIFDGMTLPDRELASMYRVFTDSDLPRVEAGSFFFDARAAGLPSLREAPAPPPLPPAELLRVSTTELPAIDGAPQATRVALEMLGGETGQSEFKSRIALPPGSWVTGFALYIGDERVEGRLFEKKAALWVYRMIRDDNRVARLRDPATLALEPDGSLRLQVFPFDPGQTRRVELDVVSMAGGEARVVAGDRVERLALASAAAVGSAALRFDSGSGAAICLDAASLPSGFLTKREPYLEIFVDRSRSGLDDAEVARLMDLAGDMYPEARYVQASLVSLEARVLFPKPLEWSAAKEALRALDLDAALPDRRGLLMEPAMQRRALAAAAAPEAERFYPIWVVGLGGSNTFDPAALTPYASLHPESPAPLALREGAAVDARPALAQVPVAVARIGGIARAFALGEGARWLRFPGADANAPLELFDAARGVWERASTRGFASEGGGFLQSVVELDLVAARASLNPAFAERRRAAIVAESKRLNLLTPAVAFTVVENDAQWKMLEAKERETLLARGALEIDETPEPGFWALLGGLALFLGWKARGARGLKRAG